MTFYPANDGSGRKISNGVFCFAAYLAGPSTITSTTENAARRGRPGGTGNVGECRPQGLEYLAHDPASGHRNRLDGGSALGLGTTWQTCHPFHKGSAQFDWCDKLMSTPGQPFVVTLHNERNATMRSQEQGAWHQMFRRGTVVISGFGYFAERAESDGCVYYNTSLSGKGARYPDPKSQFLQSEHNYVLLTFARATRRMTVELKNLDGKVLDMKVYSSPAKAGK